MANDIIALMMWKGRQDWNFQSIEKMGRDSKIRITIKVDAHTFQSYAMAEIWCVAQGWKEIHTIPGEVMNSRNISYVSQSVDVAGFRPDCEELRRVVMDLL